MAATGFSDSNTKTETKTKRPPPMSKKFAKLVAKTISASLDEPNPDAHNFISVKFPSTKPLSFLADSTENSKIWEMRDYGEAQKHYDMAYQHALRVLNIQDFNDSRETKLHDRIRSYVESNRKKAALEADLFQVNSVKEMAWIPDPKYGSEMPGSPTERLKGQFKLKVLRQDGTIEETTPTTDWVEKRFKKSVLGVVQRVAYERLRVLESNTEGMLKSERAGFISVENEGVTCSALDKRVINKLKYLRPKQDRDIELPHKWMGYCNETKEYIELAEEWVCGNFHAPYLQQVICCCGSKKSFVEIPPGDKRQHSNIPNKDNAPKIHYQQKDGEHTCMIYAMASAVHFSGRRDIGAWIHNGAKRYMHAKNAFQSFIEQLKKRYKVFRRQKSHPNNNLDLLGPLEDGMYLARIKGSNGKDDHCVVITQKWIFDSNFEHALPRTRSSFNLCCSSDSVSCNYEGIVQIKHFPGLTTI